MLIAFSSIESLGKGLAWAFPTTQSMDDQLGQNLDP